MNENIYAVLAARFPPPSAPCMETAQGKIYSYGDVELESARLARFFLELGLQQGDRVMAQVEKSPQALFLYLAVVRAGLVFLPLNPAYQQGEVSYFLKDAAPRAVVCRPEAANLMRELGGDAHVFTLDADGAGSLIDQCRGLAAEFETRQREAHDLAALLYTSGTTGRPKGAMITHRNLSSNGLALHRAWGWKPGDVLLHALPMFHIHGLFVANHCALLNGSKMLFFPKFDPGQVIAALPRATVFMGVPTFYVRLLNEREFGREQVRNMRLFVSGSAPLLADTFHRVKERTGHAPVERYGMTETEVNASNALEGERLPESVGSALPGVSLRVADDGDRPLGEGRIGNVQVKGENVFKGYWNMPQETKREFTDDGYFRTGDMGRFDAQGRLYLVGRAKDLIISGGINVYPAEIESCIDEIPGVAESAVIGVPDADFGEAVTAVVVRKRGAGVSEKDVMQGVKNKLANFKVPKRVYFVKELPRNAMGKLEKKLLRAKFSG